MYNEYKKNLFNFIATNYLLLHVKPNNTLKSVARKGSAEKQSSKVSHIFTFPWAWSSDGLHITSANRGPDVWGTTAYSTRKASVSVSAMEGGGKRWTWWVFERAVSSFCLANFPWKYSPMTRTEAFVDCAKPSTIPATKSSSKETATVTAVPRWTTPPREGLIGVMETAFPGRGNAWAASLTIIQ